MSHETMRAAIMIGLAIMFGEMAYRGWLDWRLDFGNPTMWQPWRRREGGINGRWRTDLLVVSTLATISILSALSAVTIVWEGFAGASSATTLFLAVLLIVSVALRRSAANERLGRASSLADPLVQQAAEAAKAAQETADLAKEVEVLAYGAAARGSEIVRAEDQAAE